MLTFEAIGEWADGNVKCEWVDSSHDVNGDVADAIERTWEEMSRRPGVHLFDGPMCRLEGSAFSRQSMNLRLSRTSYKPFVGTNMHNPWIAGRYGAGMLANPVGLSCALESGDGMLLMGRRNDRVAYYPSRVHPFSGALEPAEKVDVFADVRRELREELALEADDVIDLRCVGLVYDHALMQPELMFIARSSLLAARIEARLNLEEHGGVVAAKAEIDSLQALMMAEPKPTPVGVAAMLLWARRRISGQAFEGLREMLTITPPVLVCD